MSKCFWCHKDRELNMWNLCLSCQNWFKRKIKTPVEYCDLCGTIVAKNQKGICKPCKDSLNKATSIPKRVQNIKNKFYDIKYILDEYHSSSHAFLQLDHMFTSKEKKFLEVLVNRYYDYKSLDSLGQTLWTKGVSREYVRQCEDKAILIVKRKTGLTFDDEEKEDNIDKIFNSNW